MPLTVLSDTDVSKVLHSFTREDVLELQESLADALHWYSTSNDANDYCSDYQPNSTTLRRKNGTTTVFMPASGVTGQGVKVVNMTPPDQGGFPSLENLSLDTEHSSRSSISSPTADSPRDSISTASTADTSASSSSLPVTLPALGPNALQSTDQESDKPASTIRGSLTLQDETGRTTGLLNAEEITAFRTALASTIMLNKRHSVHDLTVFGAGKQAYWHIRLAMLLRGHEIHHLNIITRNFDSARKCVMRLYYPQPNDPNYVNPIGSKYNSKTKVNLLTPMHTEYERLLKDYVRSANVLFMTTPSTKPLFPASYLTNPDGRKKGRYIVCVGSYKSDMCELHPDILRFAVQPQEHHHRHPHLHAKRQKEGGAVVVDTVSGCLKDAGEVVQAKLLPDQVVELGELFMLKREAMRKLEAEGKKADSGCAFQENSGLKEWLTRGNVIYKSVGLGLMDIVVGNELVEFARRKGVGTTIEHF